MAKSTRSALGSIVIAAAAIFAYQSGLVNVISESVASQMADNLTQNSREAQFVLMATRAVPDLKTMSRDDLVAVGKSACGKRGQRDLRRSLSGSVQLTRSDLGKIRDAADTTVCRG